MKEKNIREMARRMNLVSIDDMCRYSIPQLVVMIANKLNELFDEVGQFESDVDEVVKSQNEKIQYLLGEGLILEVENVFNGWFEDGTFDTLINQSALKKVNDRIDETNAQLSNAIINISDYQKKKIAYQIFKQKIPKSFFVNINLIYYSKLKNKQRANDKNDYKDIVSISQALPYCDVVITERYWSALIQEHKLNENYETIVSKDINILKSI